MKKLIKQLLLFILSPWIYSRYNDQYIHLTFDDGPNKEYTEKFLEILKHYNIKAGSVIQMGTLSKALGCYGAFVAGKKDLIDLLVNKAVFKLALGKEPAEIFVRNKNLTVCECT